MSNFLQIDDLTKQSTVSGANMHPDGDLVAYTVGSFVIDYKQHSAASQLWTSDASGNAQLATAEGMNATRPRWSPDGTRLGFLGRRRSERKRQLCLLTPGWSEARQVTTFGAGVTDFYWDPTSSLAAVLADDPKPDEDTKQRERGRDQIEYEKHDPFTSLWILDIDSGEARQLTSGLQVYEIAWSPDGSQIAAIVSDKPYGWSWYENRLVIVELATGEVPEYYVSERQLTRPAWSTDGSWISVITSTFSDQGMTGGDILLIDGTSGESRNLTAGHARSYLETHWSTVGQAIMSPAYEDGQAEICRLDLTGGCDVLWRGEAAFGFFGGGMSIDLEGSRFSIVRSDPDHPAEVWLGEIDGDSVDWRQVSNQNSGYGCRNVWSARSIHWQSFDDREIQGILLRSNHVDSVEPLPMITIIHGGPTGVHSFAYPDTRSMGWAHLLAARGYAIFLPNPRGSMGFGVEFAEANIGDLGGGDLQDILHGIDYCVDQGIADPERLGVAGWSYGGYLTPWAITQTNRFKAAVSGASISNWTSFHGGSTIQGFDEVFNESDPYNADGYYTFRSPIYSIDRARTPTLFLHGQRDPICPVGQAYELFRGLKDQCVETELVVYPREGHGVREREHVRDLLERIVDWFTERV